MAAQKPTTAWKKENYEISTDPSLIPFEQLNQLFDSDDFHWGKSLPPEELRTMVQASLCFVLYEITDASHGTLSESPPRRKVIGFSRWIWDRVTVAYLTDVVISSEYRGRRLGVWMMECIDETFKSLPHLRGMILIVDRGSPIETFYRKHLSMEDLDAPGILMDRKGRGTAY